VPSTRTCLAPVERRDTRHCGCPGTLAPAFVSSCSHSRRVRPTSSSYESLLPTMFCILLPFLPVGPPPGMLFVSCQTCELYQHAPCVREEGTGPMRGPQPLLLLLVWSWSLSWPCISLSSTGALILSLALRLDHPSILCYSLLPWLHDTVQARTLPYMPSHPTLCSLHPLLLHPFCPVPSRSCGFKAHDPLPPSGSLFPWHLSLSGTFTF
jgi:hypothetical protein